MIILIGTIILITILAILIFAFIMTSEIRDGIRIKRGESITTSWTVCMASNSYPKWFNDLLTYNRIEQGHVNGKSWIKFKNPDGSVEQFNEGETVWATVDKDGIWLNHEEGCAQDA